MSVKYTDASEVLLNAINVWDVGSIRNILDESPEIVLSYTENGKSLLHMICIAENFKSVKENCEDFNVLDRKKYLIYMLIDAGVDLELVDKAGNTCLFYAVESKDIFICDILLQCGADMWTKTESFLILHVVDRLSFLFHHVNLFAILCFNISIYEYASQIQSNELKEVFQKFSPGLWKAVECEDIYQVRRLINLWCRTDLAKNSILLKDIALGTGNEEIISLILGIFDTMKLIYYIFAKNIKAISSLLETNRQRIRLDLRKMSDRGAPIIYYLIQSEDIAVIELFIKHGCQLYTIMQDDFRYDMPVLYSALKAGTPVSVIEALLPLNKPHQEEMLYKILYRGQTVLEVALAQNVNIDVFNVLIDRGGPQLLCERNQVNQTVRDLAIFSGKAQYVDAIDTNISSWILHPWKYSGRRQKLALYGWNLEAIEDELKKDVYLDDYFVHYKPLQLQMKHLCEAIEKGDIKTFLELKTFLYESDESAFLWHGRVVGDGIPHLHRAVLYNRLKMVEIILAEKPHKESIDNLFDQNRRTALHYAYASASMKGIKSLLMSYGCSEHVLDKMNREPLDFRDKQDTDDMMELLHRLKSKDSSAWEIDPWKEVDTKQKTLYCEHFEEVYGKGTVEQYSDSESESSEDEAQTASACAIS
ncbi:ankyrin repeat protein [Trichonephila clavata]|uniref:Ankyrin repeat protein n=1 Tax=Trichonephila clavata TaxID=2740835 RepID=A0A8X6G9F4_TRICU|nr:ankyrin repeat protein [Trichonephila clavata]